MKFISSHISRSKPPWRVLFFGTDEFSLKTLQALNENMMMSPKDGRVVGTLDIAHPLTKKTGPINTYATMYGLTQYQWPLDDRIRLHYDVGVLASFGHLIPRKLVEAFPYGILNVHPSALPRWRGAAPLYHTILSGDTHTAVTIMSIQPKHFDVGPVLATKEMTVPPRPTFNLFRDVMAYEGGKLIIDILRRLPEAIKEKKLQGSESVTYAHKITNERSYIDWENQTDEEIDRQYRAIHETSQLRTMWQNNVVRLLDKPGPNIYPSVILKPDSPPGFPVCDWKNEVIWIRCKDGWSAFGSVMIRKKMSPKSFYNGYLSKTHFAGVCFKSVQNNLFGENYMRWISNPRSS